MKDFTNNLNKFHPPCAKVEGLCVVRCELIKPLDLWSGDGDGNATASPET